MLVPIAAAVIGLSACGGDDGESGNGASGGEDGAETALPAELSERVRDELLIGEQRLTESEADCAVARLGETLTPDQIAEAEDSDTLPLEIRTAAFEAGVRCAGR
jgi:hypothetical protein